MPLCGASMSVLRLLEARSFADVEGGAYWWLLQACLAEYVPWPYQGRRGGHPWVEVAQGFQRYERYGFRCPLQQLSGRLLDAHVLSTCRSGSLAPSYSLQTYQTMLQRSEHRGVHTTELDESEGSA